MENQGSFFYAEKIEEYSRKLKTNAGQLRRFFFYRLFTFILIFIPVSVFGTHHWWIWILTVTIVVIFFLMVKKNIQVEKIKRKLQVLKKLAEDEILALNHSFNHFDNGEEYLDINHYFAYDLDLFGEGSLYQFLNRTSTRSGRKKLAEWLIHPPLDKKGIEKKQEAIKELTKLTEWRLHYLANGKMFKETDTMSREIKNWSDLKLDLKNKITTKWLIKIIPIVTILSIIPAITGFSSIFISFFILTQWILMFGFGNIIRQYFGFFGTKSELLEKYMQLLERFEETNFHSEYLVEIQKKVKEPVSASKIFHDLKKRVKQFEYRGNLIVGFFLNSIFLWDIRCVYRLWKWHTSNHKKLAVWLDVISEIDALISLANFSFNNPEYIFPELVENEFIFGAKQLGHPLLNPEKRICNNFEIKDWPKVLIVTGANMAGKSTFLRTVGVNLILGRIGAPVCAKEMTFTPIKIYTNMRTTDSLFKDESYFFAELKRIKGVLDRLQNGENIFIILDEMLKGTNSVDKLNGSKELIRKLVNYKSVSLIATHDLKLSEMENELPDQVYNKCFEIRIKNDELIFDYKLSEGVTQTMNATFLMKKMGII